MGLRFVGFRVESGDMLSLVFDPIAVAVTIPVAADVDVNALYARLLEDEPGRPLRLDELGVEVVRGDDGGEEDDCAASYDVAVCLGEHSVGVEFSLDNFDVAPTLFNPRADRGVAFCQQLLDALRSARQECRYRRVCAAESDFGRFAPPCPGCLTLPTGAYLESKAANDDTGLVEWCPHSARVLRAHVAAAYAGKEPPRFHRLPGFVFLDPPG